MPTRRLFVTVLLTQAACAAFGLGFHHLYVTSALTQVEQEEARDELGRQYRLLAPELNRQTLRSLQNDRAAWDQLVTQWKAAAGAAADKLYLLDREGRVLATADEEGSGFASGAPVALTLKRANFSWGKFGEPIRGLLDVGHGHAMVVMASGLASSDGYLLLARSANQETISLATLENTLWAASGLALALTVVSFAVILFIMTTSTPRDGREEQPHPEIDALKQAQALVRTQETVIFGLARLADSRDPETGGHLERIAHYSSTLATALRQRPEFREAISPNFLHQIGISSALHDIGKVGVEDSVLRKPGSLTSAERSRIQCHAKIGDDCLKEIERRLGSSNFLQMARQIASAHHERWDGRGYPLGLAGEQIPLAARIVAIADVYDALSRKRVYKEALPHEQCVALIAKAAGTQFDPRIVDVFLQIADRFCQISEQFRAHGDSLFPTTVNVDDPLPIVQQAEVADADAEFLPVGSLP